ncbi:hypothetical protein QLQ12_37585 [Actinoplanes sp. NEAU-A12]|uniref:Transposase n=1 Tax=Actinoplanes sandaracinus TaxID=3045177 RepID=A0ABT6WX53_9ACTN|nr:hypothetical protein [Actinoplanes sandaracinus]MDI6104321.1 hypothetical protein [Actinoplanes sandaracinus]
MRPAVAGWQMYASSKSSADASHVVRFVRGSWLCAATVDVITGEVTSILDDGQLDAVSEMSADALLVPVTARLDFASSGT